jgi:tetratricopeptide (TPR) repeat protein
MRNKYIVLVTAILVLCGISMFAGMRFALHLEKASAPLLTQSPKEKALAMVEQGWALEQQMKLPEAIALYEQASIIDPACAVAYKHRGTSYTRMGAFEKAIPEFEKAIDLDPNHASSYYNLGLLYIGMADYDNAVKNFSEALSIEPHYSSALLNRASIYAQQRNFPEALKDYDQYLQIVPQDQKVFLARAGIYEILSDFDKALEDYHQAVALTPGDKDIYFARARVYFAKGEKDKSIADLSRVIELDADNLNAYVTRLRIYDSLHQTDNARKDLEKIKSLSWEEYQKLYTQRIAVLIAQKRYDDALRDLNPLIEENPREGKFFLLRAAVYSAKENYDAALADLNLALELVRDEPMMYINRAEIYLVRGEFEKSWDDVAKARELGARIPRSLMRTLADRSGQPDFQINPPETSGEYYNAYVRYFIEGRIRESYAVVEQALAKYPDDQDARQFKTLMDVQYPQEKPELVQISGSDSVLDALDRMKDAAYARQENAEVVLGLPGERDEIRLSFATINLLGPEGWLKKADPLASHGNRALIQYQRREGAMLPMMIVSNDQVMPDTPTALAYSRKVRALLLETDPFLKISEPRQESVKGYPASYMEVMGEGLNGIDFKFGWYQFLLEETIITIQYQDSEHQFQEGLPEFRRMIENLDIHGAS